MALNPKVSFGDVECPRGPSLALFYFLFILMICAIHLTVLETYYLRMILVFSCLTKTQIYYKQFFNNELDIISDWFIYE